MWVSIRANIRTASAALRGMVAPGLLAVLMPVAVGIIFRIFITDHDPLIAADSVAALLMVWTIGGILMATFLNNGGGAWGNAKNSLRQGTMEAKSLIRTRQQWLVILSPLFI